MNDAITLFKQTLQDRRCSYTTTRQLVFETLLQQGPLSMAELVSACAGKADRASIYRTAILFETLGVTQRLQTGWKYRIELSDRFQPHHHHMYCLGCSSTIELPEDASLEAQLKRLADAQGFRPLDHQIEIRGLCQVCREAGVTPAPLSV